MPDGLVTVPKMHCTSLSTSVQAEASHGAGGLLACLEAKGVDPVQAGYTCYAAWCGSRSCGAEDEERETHFGTWLE